MWATTVCGGDAFVKANLSGMRGLFVPNCLGLGSAGRGGVPGERGVSVCCSV